VKKLLLFETRGLGIYQAEKPYRPRGKALEREKKGAAKRKLPSNLGL